MQLAYGTSPLCVGVVVAVVVEEATLATPGEPPPPQPVTSSVKASATRAARMKG
jgi:hypothetical protein